MSERFNTRTGMMFAMLGMAVGTGNIWRFPRIAAKNGGGEFLVAWIVFLLVWSIPIIMLEFGMGRKTRSGPIKSFMQLLGPRWAWMGAFCVFVTTAITFYYCVVAGWTIRYAIAAIFTEIPEASPGAFWISLTASSWPILFHAIVIGLTSWVVIRGVKSIEKVTSVLIPALLALIIVLVVRSLFLPGASEGLAYLFTVDWGNLANPKIWIEALTQNAWDTGAGWGLVLCYAAYMRDKEDTALNAVMLPIANNIVSLMAGIMIFSTVFSAVPQLMEQAHLDPGVLKGLGSLEKAVQDGETFSADLVQKTVFSEGNSGITFIWMPQLFKTMFMGQFFMVLFFVALAFAAFTSMIAQVEVTTRAFVDAGMKRTKATQIICIGVFTLGLPSAIWMPVLENQDWVWGVALMLAGLFFAISIIPYGVKKFREENLNHENSDIRVGRIWDFVIVVVAPAQMIFLLIWFFYSSWKENPDTWLKPFDPDNLLNAGTMVVQWALVLALLILANKWIVNKTSGSK
jgi:NSS family neurotransmitter:Na+ symporter